VKAIDGNRMVIALSVVFTLNDRFNVLIEICCGVIIYLVVIIDFLISIDFSTKFPSSRISIFPLCYLSAKWNGDIAVGVLKI
jgi:hypothetical protein